MCVCVCVCSFLFRILIFQSLFEGSTSASAPCDVFLSPCSHFSPSNNQLVRSIYLCCFFHFDSWYTWLVMATTNDRTIERSKDRTNDVEAIQKNAKKEHKNYKHKQYVILLCVLRASKHFFYKKKNCSNGRQLFIQSWSIDKHRESQQCLSFFCSFSSHASIFSTFNIAYFYLHCYVMIFRWSFHLFCYRCS